MSKTVREYRCPEGHTRLDQHPADKHAHTACALCGATMVCRDWPLTYEQRLAVAAEHLRRAKLVENEINCTKSP